MHNELHSKLYLAFIITSSGFIIIKTSNLGLLQNDRVHM